MGSTAHNGAGTVLIARNRADLTDQRFLRDDSVRLGTAP